MKSRLILLSIFCLIGFHLQAYKLKPYIPKENLHGIGVIVCPGGSYFWLDKEIEGDSVAVWLNENGIAAFVLEYSHAGWASYAYHFRVPGRTFPAGYNDLCKAIEQVRNNAGLYGVNADRIGCMGFSAGGHLVMHAAEQLAGLELCPQFVAPCYPVVSMKHPCTHKRSRRGLLGEFPKKAMKDSLSLEHHVKANCPPVFLMNCDDDPIVHPHNSELLDSALTVHNVPHIYEHYRTGGHGFGSVASRTTAEAIQWKNRFLSWLYTLFNL